VQKCKEEKKELMMRQKSEENKAVSRFPSPLSATFVHFTNPKLPAGVTVFYFHQ
jgi:hypothetical protein